jgi:predicted nuclease of predicted toxin-antitoxin system
MKILLDECLPVRLKESLNEFEVFSVSEMGWRSLKNGKFLKTAEENNFDVFLTVDKKLESQQNLKSF